LLRNNGRRFCLQALPIMQDDVWIHISSGSSSYGHIFQHGPAKFQRSIMTHLGTLIPLVIRGCISNMARWSDFVQTIAAKSWRRHTSFQGSVFRLSARYSSMVGVRPLIIGGLANLIFKPGNPGGTSWSKKVPHHRRKWPSSILTRSLVRQRENLLGASPEDVDSKWIPSSIDEKKPNVMASWI
jgi:hypothetical protein